MHISKKDQKEDMKSTAYSFTSVGIIGIILLILFLADVLPFHAAGYMKIMMAIVMGGTLCIFLFVGIHAFMTLKKLDAEADAEETLVSEITEWFCSSYTAADIDENQETESTEETRYFDRYEVMKQYILTKYPDLEDDFLDALIEALYAEIF